MKYNEIILGGGIAGLLWSYYHPESILITDKIGGQFSSPFQLGPKYLHVDESMKRLFKDLNINPSIKKIKIGFYYDGRVHPDNTEENRKLYFEKTRGKSTEPYKTIMSANKTEFDSYDMDVSEIIKILEDKVKEKVIIDKIANINLRNSILSGMSEDHRYSKLISTIPMNTFLKLSVNEGISSLFEFYPTSFMLTKDCFYNFEDYNYIYFPEKKYEFHRITKIKEGFVFEYKRDLGSNENIIVIKVGQLINNDIEVKIPNVEFFGRYATWKHGILTNHLVKQIHEKNI